HDLDQWRTCAVEVDRRVAAATVQILAGILFHVDAGDAGALDFAAQLELQTTALGEGLLELADLVALGQIRIEVVLAREDALLTDLQAKGERGARRQTQR